jgi:hypothetical protein
MQAQQSTLSALYQDPSDTASKAAAIAVAFYPVSLEDSDSDSTEKPTCAVASDLASDGSPNTVLAFYPAGRGKIMVLRNKAGVYEADPDDSSASYAVSGKSCSADRRDLSGTGKQLVILKIQSLKPLSTDYIFSWDGEHLRNVGPTEDDDGAVSSSFYDAWYRKYWEGNALAVLSLDECPSCDPSEDFPVYRFVYRINHGRYEVSAHDVFASPYVVDRKSKGLASTGTFVVDDRSSGPYSLHVVTGDENGNNQAGEVDVVVNGFERRVIFASLEHKTVWTAPLEGIVKGTNTISVTIRGNDGSEALVAIEDTISK